MPWRLIWPRCLSRSRAMATSRSATWPRRANAGTSCWLNGARAALPPRPPPEALAGGGTRGPARPWPKGPRSGSDLPWACPWAGPGPATSWGHWAPDCRCSGPTYNLASTRLPAPLRSACGLSYLLPPVEFSVFISSAFAQTAAGADVRGAVLRDDPPPDEAPEGTPRHDRRAGQGRRGGDLGWPAGQGVQDGRNPSEPGSGRRR